MKPALPYADRSEAGCVLAAKLSRYKNQKNVQVLGLARGGIAVASEVARALQAPLDVLVVRKLTLPSQPELALGAMAIDGTKVVDEEIVRRLGVGRDTLEASAGKLRMDLDRRERAYRAGRPPLDLTGRIAILVDDGLATGSTMLAAVRFVRKQSPKKIVVAIPVASAEALKKLRPEVDECVCPAIPQRFYAVGDWYDSFPQLKDAEVTKALNMR